ncbi:MAG: cytochrome c biogenesis protein CcdA [Bacteriovoracia bacterium]
METLFLELKTALEAGTLMSSLGAVFLAYLGGIFSSFTPCIYPMIPITIGFIGGARKDSVKKDNFLIIFFVLGMASVYTALGIAASLSGKIFGTLTNSTGWYLTIGIVMILSSLWTFEIIKFDPNTILSRFLHKKNPVPPQATLLGAFVLGSTSGFIASPCTTPVLTTILSYIATEQSVAFGAVLMMAFALGLGTILVLLGSFAGLLKHLPKSGAWLNRVKVLSGLIILAMGEYFIFKAGTLK